jgi:hypothetical protein
MIDQLLAGVAGGGVVAFFGWLLRESLKAWLQRELTSEAEHLKHDLQREMLKAQLSTTRLHAIYPLMFEKLRRAEGAVGGLIGLQFAPSYDEYDRADFERLLDDLSLPGGEKSRILQELDHDRRSGIAELNKTKRRVDLQRAQRRLFRAKNFIILKSLYASEPIKNAALGVCNDLWGAWVDIDVGTDANDFKFIKNAQEELESAGKALLALETMMRRELHPTGDGAAPPA